METKKPGEREKEKLPRDHLSRIVSQVPIGYIMSDSDSTEETPDDPPSIRPTSPSLDLLLPLNHMSDIVDSFLAAIYDCAWYLATVTE